MRTTKTLIYLIFLLLITQTSVKACHYSSFCLDSISPAPGGNFYIHTTLCVGGGVSGGVTGANGNTQAFLFGFSSVTPGFAVTSFTSPITSLATNTPFNGVNVGSQPAFNAQQALYYNNSANFFACINSTPACGLPASHCYPLVFQVNYVPDSIRVYGIEGNNTLGAGCGNDLLIDFSPGSMGCCILPFTETITPSSGCGMADGSASVNITSSVGPLNYLWSNGNTTNSISNVFAGSYSVTVLDSTGCKLIRSFNIPGNSASPTVTLSSISNENCNQSNGSIAISASGGSGSGYAYLWSTGATTPAISGLSGGNYIVTVTDGVGCTTTANYTISSNPGPSATLSNATLDHCGRSDGTLGVVVSGGNTPYTYLWSNGSTNPTASGLAGGTYTVTVTDALGCTDVFSGTVSTYSGPSATLTTTNATCLGNNNGSATVNIGSSIAPTNFSWSTGATAATASNLGAGTYTVTLTDGIGCTNILTATVNTQFSSPTVTSTVTDDYCALGNGTANAMATGGTSPYNYTWSNGQTSMTAAGLAAGNYTVTITDANGCTTSNTVTVGSIAAMTLATSATPASAAGASDGTASTTITGGNAPFTYNWSNGGNTASISGLAPGSYTVTVTDALGCEVIDTVTVGFLVGLDALSGSGYRVMPNPVQNMLTVQREGIQISQSAEIRIYDALGRMLVTQIIPPGETIYRWNAETASKGVYFVRIISGDQDLNVRIIKQ